MSEQELAGQTADGEVVHRITLMGGGLTATLLTWGAILQDLRLLGHRPPLVLGFPNFEDYPAHSPFFGATVGRCANRIAGGAFVLDGEPQQLDRNEKGVNHLHGGAEGISKRVWRIASQGEDRVRFEIDDPDGHMGYPGACRIACTYHLKPGGVLSIVHTAESDRTTICNMAHHSYFNLDGGDNVLDHDIRIAAEHYLPVDETLIPTGAIQPVENSAFDLRRPRSIRHEVDGSQVIYDHNFCLSAGRGDKRAVALVHSPKSGVSMEVRTTEPGLQFYAGHKLGPDVPGLQGAAYGPHAGFCMEAQVWPDAVNHDGFPSAVLQPGETLRQETDYVFRKVEPVG